MVHEGAWGIYRGTHHPLPTMTSADATVSADTLVMSPAEATAAVAAAEAPVTRLCKSCGVNLPLSSFNKGTVRFSCRKHVLARQTASRKPSTPQERVYRLLWTAAYKVITTIQHTKLWSLYIITPWPHPRALCGFADV